MISQKRIEEIGEFLSLRERFNNNTLDSSCNPVEFTRYVTLRRECNVEDLSYELLSAVKSLREENEKLIKTLKEN